MTGITTEADVQVETVTIGITKATLKKGVLSNLIFWRHATKVGMDMGANPGFIDWKVKTNPFTREIWTISVWKQDQDLNDFLRSPLHVDAMKHSADRILTGGFARATLPRADTPVTWKTARIIMNESGRLVYAKGHEPTLP